MLGILHIVNGCAGLVKSHCLDFLGFCFEMSPLRFSNLTLVLFSLQYHSSTGSAGLAEMPLPKPSVSSKEILLDFQFVVLGFYCPPPLCLPHPLEIMAPSFGDHNLDLVNLICKKLGRQIGESQPEIPCKYGVSSMPGGAFYGVMDLTN